MDERLNTMEMMCKDAIINIEKARAGNKAAKRRLRAFTLEMGNKIGKQFRKNSTKETV